MIINAFFTNEIYKNIKYITNDKEHFPSRYSVEINDVYIDIFIPQREVLGFYHKTYTWAL